MIGNKLKELRKQKQITQNDLAHLLGTNVKSIRNWEDDISDPNLQSFCKILKVFHISANEMLSMFVMPLAQAVHKAHECLPYSPIVFHNTQRT